MCDYSLHNVATRPAQIEDKLVTTKRHGGGFLTTSPDQLIGASLQRSHRPRPVAL
jgi:hypothetical protein